MDIVLDSNAYSSDVRLRSPRSVALWEYARKSNAVIVLFKLVHDEVVENYRRNFTSNVIDKWNKANGFLITEHERPVAETELQALSGRLLKPTEHVKVNFVADYSGVVLDEVIRRGIARIAPANSKGEELRDVVLWLSVVDYASKHKREVSFVTNDSGFWREGADEPAEQIQADITTAKASIRLYRKVESFLAANALTAKAADSKWASELFAASGITELLLARLAQSEYPGFTVESHSIVNTEFEAGTLYEISAGAQFAELTFKVRFDLQLRGWTYNHLLPYLIPSINPDVNLNNLIINTTYLQPSTRVPVIWGESTNALLNAKLSDLNYAWGEELNGISEVGPQKAVVDVRAKFSVRITSGQPTEVYLDNFKVIL